jgi:hypothetical protein
LLCAKTIAAHFITSLLPRYAKCSALKLEIGMSLGRKGPPSALWLGLTTHLHAYDFCVNRMLTYLDDDDEDDGDDGDDDDSGDELQMRRCEGVIWGTAGLPREALK